MKSFFICCALFVLLPSCSTDLAKRTVYDSLQNKAQMDCRSEPGRPCPREESYDDYQRSLQRQRAPERSELLPGDGKSR